MDEERRVVGKWGKNRLCLKFVFTDLLRKYMIYGQDNLTKKEKERIINEEIRGRLSADIMRFIQENSLAKVDVFKEGIVELDFCIIPTKDLEEFKKSIIKNY